jgi:hypothetical protein
MKPTTRIKMTYFNNKAQRCILQPFHTPEQRDILQNHGAAWHPSTPRSIMASINTTEQLGINAAPWY